MTAHLLLITLGPVQEFIAQARRTRDLWYGSHLLSELSRTAARALAEGGAQLIFPTLRAGDAELQPCCTPLRPDRTPPQNVANKILAKVPGGMDPCELARKTREVVFSFWRDDLAGKVKQQCAGLLADGIDAIWNEQTETFLEFVASWAPLGDYAEARRQIERAISGRKLLRDFDPWLHGRGSVPKSSLDGARETVLKPPRERDGEFVRRYRIADGEQLDAIGLVKRAGGTPGQFVPIINIAFASWLNLAHRVAAAELEKLRGACGEISLSRVDRPDLPCAAHFPFDASVLLPNRWRPVFEEQGLKCDPERWGRQYVRPLLDRLEEPYPYVACLAADGDHMGKAIDRLDSADAHRKFSAALAEFASQARKVVEQDHRGALVYSGGDDVLAFLPLPEALACADQLRKSFAEAMAAACPAIAAGERPTLSVGLGIGHVMESMSDLLELGRQAEREAKRDRNALAVIVDKRSGGTQTWHEAWRLDPVRALQDAARLLQERLSTRKIHEIADTLTRLPEAGDATGQGWGRVLAMEVRRSLARVEGGAVSPESAGLALDEGADYAALQARVRAWVARMLVARTFAQAEPSERRRGQEVAA